MKRFISFHFVSLSETFNPLSDNMTIHFDNIDNYELIYFEFDIKPKMAYRDSYFAVYNWQEDELFNYYLSTSSDAIIKD